MFLAAGNILRPVTGVSLLVVEQSTNAELLCGGSVPAGPVAGAGGLVPEYSVQPVTVLRALGGIWQGTSIKISSVLSTSQLGGHGSSPLFALSLISPSPRPPAPVNIVNITNQRDC